MLATQTNYKTSHSCALRGRSQTQATDKNQERVDLTISPFGACTLIFSHSLLISSFTEIDAHLSFFFRPVDRYFFVEMVFFSLWPILVGGVHKTITRTKPDSIVAIKATVSLAAGLRA